MMTSLYGKAVRICVPPNPASLYYDDELRCQAICEREPIETKKAYNDYRGLAHRIVVTDGKGSPDDMEDVYQNAFEKLVETVDAGKLPPLTSQLSSWLFKVIRNEWLQWLQSGRRRQNHEDAFGLKYLIDPLSEHLAWTEEHKGFAIQIIVKIFEQVKNPKHRQLLQLHFFRGFTPDETAEELGYESGRVVSKQASQLFSKLKKEILEQFKKNSLI